MRVGKESNVRLWSWTVAIEVYFQFEHVVFISVSASNSKRNRRLFEIRRCGANCSVRFSYIFLGYRKQDYMQQNYMQKNSESRGKIQRLLEFFSE
jgi:hypothetical protein